MEKRECLEVIHGIDAKIRAGDFMTARAHLRQIQVKQWPRTLYADLAALARRAQLFFWGLRLLNPIIYRSNEGLGDASPAELLEYGYLLSKVSATDEALAVLSRVDSQKYPIANLYRGLAHFPDWKYHEATSFLNAYIRDIPENNYMTLVARVNLAAAYIFTGHYDAADETLGFLRSATRMSHFNLLATNVYELSAQLEFYRQRFDRARSFLQAATSLTNNDQDSISNLYIHKWFTIISCRMGESDTSVLRRLSERATNHGQWEVARDCDLHRALIDSDKGLFLSVYFGTPYTSYRERILDMCPFVFDLPATHTFTLGSPQRQQKVFDLEYGQYPGLKEDLLPGGALHRLFYCLCRDFYKPATVMSAFHLVFQREIFNPNGSRRKVHQLILRLRNWLAENQLPLQIDGRSGTFPIKLTDPANGFSYLIKRGEYVFEPHLLSLRRFQTKLDTAQFRASQLRREFQMSVGSASELLNWGIQNGLLKKVGSGKKTTYEYLTPAPSQDPSIAKAS